MKSITITLDEDIARWVNACAVQHNSSISQFINCLLRQQMLVEVSYESAMQQYLSTHPSFLKEPSQSLPSREEVNDRGTAAKTGESTSQCTDRVLEKRQESFQESETASKLVEAMQEISHRCRALPDLDTRSVDEILGYDERGLFR